MPDDLYPDDADRRRAAAGRIVVTVGGVAAILAAVGDLLWESADLLVAVVALLILAATVAALIRVRRLDRGLLGGGLAVTVLATGIFTIAFYRSRIEQLTTTAPVAAAPQVVLALPPWKKPGEPVRLSVPFGPGDMLPQGAFLLNPPKAGPDPYHGDVAVECETESKNDSVQNCTGRDTRTFIFAPIDKRALIGIAAGDSLTDPNACEESAGVDYEGEYLQIPSGKTFCLRERGDTSRMIGLRVVSTSDTQPLPAGVVLEAVSWSR
jgi:hypothetical protein